MTFVLKRGDRLPDMVVTLDDNGSPLDLTTATSIQARGSRHGVVVVDETVTGTVQGVVTVTWPAGSTDQVGLILFEFVVTWPGGKEETFPQDGFERVRISPDGA